MNDVLAVILAGGKGARLEPLTRDRAKPAVPFAGSYRIVDFALSNCFNSHLRRILLLTQYKMMSLDRHINLGWRNLFRAELGEYIEVVPPQQRLDQHWYMGTADAVYQNIYTMEKQRPEHILVLAGDHIYKMNFQSLLNSHVATAAEMTVAALVVDSDAARQFGVMQVDGNHRVVGFEEKPGHPQTLPHSDQCLASMGIYMFRAEFLFDQLCRDAANVQSAHDFGRNIIPSIIGSSDVRAYPFVGADGHTPAYWRDVGTLDAYYCANMDLLASDARIDLYDEKWPIRPFPTTLPPAKIGNPRGFGQPSGIVEGSLLTAGSIVMGGTVMHSVLGPRVRVQSHADVRDSILFDGVEVGHHARIRRAIVEKGVVIPPHDEIGFDSAADRQRGLHITDGGCVVVSQDYPIFTMTNPFNIDKPSTVSHRRTVYAHS